MLFALGHGQRVLIPGSGGEDAPRALARGGSGNGALPKDVVPLAQVAPGLARTTPNGAPRAAQRMPQRDRIGGPFAYFFPDAPDAEPRGDALAALDALAEAMIEQAGDPEGANSAKIPAVFTYLGQFIDHDITVQTDGEVGQSVIEPPANDPQLKPLPRDVVVGELSNLRKGTLGLDSLYGDGPDTSAPARKLRDAMRSRSFPGMMRLGRASDVPGRRPPVPADPAADLLRLGTLIGEGVLRESDILGTSIEPAFAPNGQLNLKKAVIGDARNDENLVIAQLQVAFLRFHNRIVTWLQGQPDAPSGSDALYERAKELVRWHYQWLVVNCFLPTICDRQVLSDVIRNEASLYRSFAERVRSEQGAFAADHLPLPLEFSVAAFRYGHSMVRGNYDHNRFFGRDANGQGAPGAPFELLFAFTGDGRFGEGIGAPDRPTLPSDWIIEWDRFVLADAAFPDRMARKIDTQLAPPLSTMSNAADGVFKHLAKRNLRRGHRLNIPSAQSCIEALNKGQNYGRIEPLGKSDLCYGPTGDVVKRYGLAEHTPLWFYVLKEAEVRGGGEALGPLGSRLVAETLVGLAVCDESSYWHRSGSGPDGRWHPSDGAKPQGVEVVDIPSLLEAAMLLDRGASSGR